MPSRRQVLMGGGALGAAALGTHAMADVVPCTRCGGSGIEPGTTPIPPVGDAYDDTPITSRFPKLYLKLDESSGAPVDSAGAGYAGQIKVVGTPVAYGVETAKGPGIRLGTDCYIEATHDPVFETPGADRDNVHVESEMTASFHCLFPEALQDDWILASKANHDYDLTPSWSLRVYATGAVELRIRKHKYRPETRVRTGPDVVKQGEQHHFTVSLGYEGAWFTVDGRMAEWGLKTLAWWGLDHRHNGVEEGGMAVSTRVTNTSSIRLGRSGDQSTSADIVITKFALFYEGTVRTTIGQKTKGLTLEDAQALAGAKATKSGKIEHLPDPLYSNTGASPAAGTNVIQDAIDNCTPNGTVTLVGDYTQSEDLVMKRGVRLTSSRGATISFTNDAKLCTPIPIDMPALSGGGDLSAGVQSYNVNNKLSQDAVFLVIDSRSLGSLYNVKGVHNEAAKRSDLIPVHRRSDTNIRFARAPFFNYPARTRLATVGIETTPDVQIDGKITLRKNGGSQENTLVNLNAARRPRLHGITIEQTTTSVPYLLACILYGCVEAQVNSCKITTTSPQGPNGAYHPYALKFAGCANYDLFNHVGHSNGWHAVDNECDNLDDQWGMPKVVATAHYGGQFGDVRNGRMSTKTNNFPAVCHTSSCIRFLDLWFTSGGGISIDGYAHNIEMVWAAPGGNRTQIAHTRGVGATRVWHCDFNNGLGNWGNGAWGMTKCSYGDLHYHEPVKTSTFTPVPHELQQYVHERRPGDEGLPPGLGSRIVIQIIDVLLQFGDALPFSAPLR